MYLHKISIENFRGIRSADIEFGDTTVLIGENDSGKTSILEAICMVLSANDHEHGLEFGPFDFYRLQGKKCNLPAGRIRIILTFCERYNNEWTYLRNNEIGLVLEDDENKLQELSLEVIADPEPDGNNSPARWELLIEGKQARFQGSDLEMLAWIRRLNPVFRIRAGLQTGLTENIVPEEQGVTSINNGDARTEEYKQELKAYYQQLLKGVDNDGNNEDQARYSNALQKLDEVAALFVHNNPPLEQIIYDILGRKPLLNHTIHQQRDFKHGSAVEKIGYLLFTAALLQSGSLMADPSAEPILIIEDPEAQLHPMTLQAVKSLIGKLKWQKILTTNSGSLLSDFPLQNIRRIQRKNGHIFQYGLAPDDLSKEELRRLSYHVRMRLSSATFARCWLLVEGESEIWLLPHIARLMGYDLAMEGVVCVEFAQCGISPLIKAARHLGIEWYLLADGDAAGKSYIESARHFARQDAEDPSDRCMRFRETDIEHHLFFNGYADVYFEYSGIPAHNRQNMQPRRVIGRAIHRHSKPFMAVAIVEAMARAGSPGVPPQISKLIRTCIHLAKNLAE